MNRVLVILLLVAIFGCKEGEVEIDFPIAGASDIEISEGNLPQKSVFLNITLSEPAPLDASLTLSTTSDGTATPDEDFLPLSNELISFTKGQQSQSATLTIIGDENIENPETVVIQIGDPVNLTLSNTTFTVTILNDDENTTVVIPSSGNSSPETYPGMELVWRDEFNGTQIDDTYWTFETGGNGWGNQELQFYREENAFIYEGNLVIEAKKENFGGRSYTSARMITMNKFEFQYGRVDIRVNLPYGQGIWPATWMLGSDFDPNEAGSVGWPHCGEIDIMEMIGGNDGNGNAREKTIHGTTHWQASFGYDTRTASKSLNSGIFNDKFYVFSIEWDEEEIRWYLDNVQFHSFSINQVNFPDRSEFHQPFFLIFNVAVGGIWPGSPDDTTVFPQRMIIDYVRVFQQQ